MNEEWSRCGCVDVVGCTLFRCCRVDRRLRFCLECADFPCEELGSSVGLHPDWLAELAKQLLMRRYPDLVRVGRRPVRCWRGIDLE